MRNFLRYYASLRHKLYRPTSCNLSFTRHRYTGTGFSGPEPTEPTAGSFQGWDTRQSEFLIPSEVDLAIIGGGLVGLCTAFFIKNKFPRSFTVAVIEKDPSYTQSSSALSVCGIRHQYSMLEHIQMSLFASEFLCDIEDYLCLQGVEPPDVLFNPQGYLLLSSKDEVKLMERDHKTQIEAGANVELMTQTALQKKFPYLSVDDVELASYGLEKQGWLDPTLLIAAMKAKLASYDVLFVTGEVVGFSWEKSIVTSIAETTQERTKLMHVNVQTGDGRIYPIQFCMCFNAAGASSRHIARLAGIGLGKEALSFDLPVMSRNNFIYVLHCPSGPGLSMPMLLDVSGLFLRREGLRGNYICSAVPPLTSSGLNDSTLDPVEYFDNIVKPSIIRRIPSMEQLQVVSCWTRQMEYNYFDRCPVVGNHPYHRNFYLSSGSVGHGAQFAPAIGRAFMELITYGDYSSINCSPFTFDRILDDEPMSERLVL